MFSPEVLTEPLPPALRLSLTRNFAFFTRIFTQFFGAPCGCVRAPGLGLFLLTAPSPTDPNQQREVRQAIPGLSKRQ